MSPSTADAGTAPRRVLIVEDHPDGRESLRLLLCIWGFEVRVAEDGPQGVREALAWRPDIAVVDIGLPGLNGYEVAHRLREALDGHIRLVALTAWGRAEDRQRALDAGFDAHLTKPADLAELSRLLKAA
jgi:CheY-like chemotaxis protein